MTTPLLIAFPGNDAMARSLVRELDAALGEVEIRQFPDGETYVRYRTEVVGRHLMLVCTLDRPDTKFLPLMFSIAAARDLGAHSVGLIAPYLAYMRQDQRFHPGEAVTSGHFAAAISGLIDWLVTVDPHLHRIGSLAQLYRVPAVAVQSAPLLADWISRNVEQPLLIGPDTESEQWVAAVAQRVAAPFVTLEKTRHGDHTVAVSVPDLHRWPSHTAVLIDDVISTAGTMIAALRHIQRWGPRSSICVAVHGLFAGDAYRDLRKAGAGTVATTNSVRHLTNVIDLSGLIADGVKSIGQRQP